MNILETKTKDDVVVLRARTVKYRRAPYYIAPLVLNSAGDCEDGLNNPVLGDLTEADKARIRKAFPLSPEKSFMIKDKMVFNMSVDYEVGLLALALTDEMVADSKKTCRVSQRFYLERKELESREESLKLLNKAEAIQFATRMVNELSGDKIKDAVRLLNVVSNVNTISDVKAVELILKEADERPTKFLNSLKKDKFANQRIFIHKLVDHRILNKRGDGYYNEYGSRIATDIDDMVDFLRDNHNSELINKWSEDMQDFSLIAKREAEGKILKTDQEKGKKNSKDYKGRELMDLINSLETVEDVINFTAEDEDRSTVLAALKERQEFLAQTPPEENIPELSEAPK